jgi:recombination protein RecA|tara:strand:+ start:26370 stop:27497 length:1128 start_codon:yes stop_codon:yes gene_type:complete
MAKVTKLKKGSLDIASIRKIINKKAGREVAHSLEGDNPTEVKEFIPTGSRWLDSIVCKGHLGGIPVGKISEIAGLEATGKSFMAAQIAGNAQKQGIDVVYFDSESAIDPSFLERAGCDLNRLMYVQAESVEFVLETIEELLSTGNKWLFIWDSLALTPSISDVEGDFNPQSSMAVKPRILSKGMAKLTLPIADNNATLLVLNQLKTNMAARTPAEAMTTPYFTPGGKAMAYAYSLRVWLTARKAKASFIVDDNGYRIGSEVKVKLEKSRFGTAGRTCNFKILWGDEDIGVQDEESWFDAIQVSERLKQSGAWFTLVKNDGSEEKFQRKNWTDKLQKEDFRESVLTIMDEDVIMKFKNREGNAQDFYDSDDPPAEK